MKQSVAINPSAHRLLWFYFIWLFLLSTMLSLYGKSEAFFIVNHYRNPLLDFICVIATYMGDGLFILLLVAAFTWMKKRKVAWSILVSFLLSGLISILLKHLINEPRPISFFHDPNMVLGVQGISFARSHGFPSGHTTSAFAAASVIAFSELKCWSKFFGFFIACLVGYSRVYLGQHFIGDVLAGTIIGGVSGYWCASRCDLPIIKYGIGLEYLFRKKPVRY